MSNQIAHSQRRRGWPRLAGFVLALVTLNRHGDSVDAQSSCGPAINPIVCENQKTGDPDTAWDITNGAGDASIQGFATDISVLFCRTGLMSHSGLPGRGAARAGLRRLLAGRFRLAPR